MGPKLIPKRIIQTGKSRDLAIVARASVASLCSLNPDFEYLYFDDMDVENFVDAHFPQYQELFNSFPYRIQKYDFFRYLAVFHFGGFYFDLDFFLARGLSDLCAHSCVFSFEELSLHRFLCDTYGMDWEVANYAFGAAAGHPFIGAVIDNCVRAQRDPKWAASMWKPIPVLLRDEYYVLDTTGPGLVSRTLAEFPRVSDYVTVLFPKDVHDVSCWHQFGDYGVHLQDGGWRAQKGFWRRRLGAMWEARARASNSGGRRSSGATRSLDFSLQRNVVRK